MPNSDFPAPKLSLAFAKIVANPTPSSWSQVYNAGSLFAALSLSVTGDSDEETNLPAIGKDLFNNLEAEFFTLEEKKLQTIRSAIEKTFTDLKSDVSTDACLAFFKGNILYLFIVGKGKIIMKRANKLGTLLENKNPDLNLKCASGYLEHGDLLLLETDHFAGNVSDANINKAFELELPNDIAESLSPHVHEKEDGSQAAIIIAYNGTAKPALDQFEDTEPTINEPVSPEISAEPSLPAYSPKFKFKFKLKLPISGLTRTQIISICLGIIILIALIVGIIFTKTNQENSKYQALYLQVSTQAQKNIADGNALSKLNESLAADSYTKAEQIINDNLNKFKSGSSEQSKLQALLIQVQNNLKSENPANSLTLKITQVNDNDLLNIEKNNTAMSLAQDDNSIYLLSDKNITTIDKSTGAKKTIISNNQDWSSAVSISPYQGNVYVLDQKAGILKYIAGQDGFSKTNYFKGTAPDLTGAQSLSIDGRAFNYAGQGS